MIRVLADSECLLSYFTNQKHSIEETEKLFELLESRKIEVYFIDKCLNNTELYKAKLSYTSCKEADLRNAYLVEVDLTGTELDGVEFINSRFGYNLGISEIQKSYLITRGAIFEDVPSNNRAILITSV